MKQSTETMGGFVRTLRVVATDVDHDELALTEAAAIVRRAIGELERLQPRAGLEDETNDELQSLAEELLRRVARISKARMVRAERASR